MTFVFDPTASVADEVRRVATERLDEAIASLGDLDGADAERIEDAVHDVRKRCKESRAAARLVRSSIGEEFARFNGTVRDAALMLAPIRDAHALLATFDDLRAAGRGGRDGVGDELERVREGQADAADEASRIVRGGDPLIEEARHKLVAARERIERWEIDDGFDSLAAGVEDTYARGRRALRRARTKPTDERLHEWRKAVKNLWYQVRLLELAAPSALSPLVASLDDAGEALGDDHDLAVLVARLTADPERYGGKRDVKRARRLARRQQDDLRRRAFRLGATIYAESPEAFVHRVEAYWDRTVRDGPELPTGGIAELADDERRVPASPAAPGTVAAERERKFLVADPPVVVGEGTVFRQGYLAIDGTVSVRVRDAGAEGCTLTIKAGHGARRTELEFPLTSEQFAIAWEHTGERRINKTRHRLPLGASTIELDVFHDELEGLALAEVEFADDDSMAAFEPPEWFGTEVTDDVRYTNASLAVNAAAGLPSDQPAA